MPSDKTFWKECEEQVVKEFIKGGWYVKRQEDSKDTGGSTEVNPGDFIVSKDFITFFVEVKSTIKDVFPMSNIRSKKDQNIAIANAVNQKVPVLYVIFTGDLRGSVYTGYDILNNLNKELLEISEFGGPHGWPPQDMLEVYKEYWKKVELPRKKKGVSYENTRLR